MTKKSRRHLDPGNENKIEENKEQKKDIQKGMDELKKENEELRDKFSVLEENEKKNKEDMLRLHAEFLNFKNRLNKEKEDVIKNSICEFYNNLLPIADNLETAIEKSASASNVQDVVEGLKLIYLDFRKILETEGLEIIDPAPGDPFNPEIHEAIDTVEGENKNTVMDVHKKGYKYGNRLIRPAQVKVVI